MDINEDLEIALAYIKSAQEDFKNLPEASAINLLLTALEPIEEKYIDWCAEQDEYEDVPEGTTHKSKSGVSMEFYIESLDWHQVSRELQKLKKNNA